LVTANYQLAPCQKAEILALGLHSRSPVMLCFFTLVVCYQQQHTTILHHGSSLKSNLV